MLQLSVVVVMVLIIGNFIGINIKEGMGLIWLIVIWFLVESFVSYHIYSKTHKTGGRRK
jgi:fatty-acid desaturase